MDKQKMETLVETLYGMTYSEWSRVRICVEKTFDSAKSRVQLQDAESLKIFLGQEFDFVEQSANSNDIKDEVFTALRALGYDVADDDNILIQKTGLSHEYRVERNDSYFGMWDSQRKTFVD